MATKGPGIRGMVCVAALLTTLTGCDQLSASLGISAEKKESSPRQSEVVIGEPVEGIAGPNSVEAPNIALDAPSGPPVAGAGVQVTVRVGLPADGPDYQMHLVEVQTALRTGSPGRLVGVPTKVSANGYPIYPATCTFYPDHAECELAGGEVSDEGYLQAHTTVIRNVDVLHGDMICGIVCIDDQGNVLGHVSKAMQAWRDKHCTWVDYGTARCG